MVVRHLALVAIRFRVGRLIIMVRPLTSILVVARYLMILLEIFLVFKVVLDEPVREQIIKWRWF